MRLAKGETMEATITIHDKNVRVYDDDLTTAEVIVGTLKRLGIHDMSFINLHFTNGGGCRISGLCGLDIAFSLSVANPNALIVVYSLVLSRTADIVSNDPRFQQLVTHPHFRFVHIEVHTPALWKIVEEGRALLDSVQGDSR